MSRKILARSESGYSIVPSLIPTLLASQIYGHQASFSPSNRSHGTAWTGKAAGIQYVNVETDTV